MFLAYKIFGEKMKDRDKILILSSKKSYLIFIEKKARRKRPRKKEKKKEKKLEQQKLI